MDKVILRKNENEMMAYQNYEKIIMRDSGGFYDSNEPWKITCIRCQVQYQADREKTGAIPSTNLPKLYSSF